MYCSREYQTSTRLNQQYEKSTLNYGGIYIEISQATRFDESTDLSTTYLGRMDMTRDMIIKAGEKFPISRQGYTNGKLLDNTACSILKDTGASKSYTLKSYCM